MNKEWTDKAFATWYQPDNSLFSNQLHPALGLAGEGGELLDLWKKNVFKPGFSMWDCKHCKHSRAQHRETNWTGKKTMPCLNPGCQCYNFASILLDELGDFTYYLRILYHLEKLEYPEPYNLDIEPLDALIGMSQAAMFNLLAVRKTGRSFGLHLNSVYRHLIMFCDKMEVDLEEDVLRVNWDKLKEGDNHGWKEAR